MEAACFGPPSVGVVGFGHQAVGGEEDQRGGGRSQRPCEATRTWGKEGREEAGEVGRRDAGWLGRGSRA